jgi:hypothetical protein
MKASDFIREDANITVRNPENCKNWYLQTFDAIVVDPKYVDLDDEEKDGCVFLGWQKNVPSMCLMPGNPAQSVTSIACTNLNKAADYLSRKGVTVSPIEEDRAGTKFFEMRDCEGNTVEFREEV